MGSKPNSPERLAEIREDLVHGMAERLYLKVLIVGEGEWDWDEVARLAFKAANAFADEAARQRAGKGGA